MKVISRVIALFPGEIYLGGFASFGDVGEPFGWNPLFPGPYGRILPGVTNHFFFGLAGVPYCSGGHVPVGPTGGGQKIEISSIFWPFKNPDPLGFQCSHWIGVTCRDRKIILLRR